MFASMPVSTIQQVHACACTSICYLDIEVTSFHNFGCYLEFVCIELFLFMLFIHHIATQSKNILYIELLIRINAMLVGYNRAGYVHAASLGPKLTSTVKNYGACIVIYAEIDICMLYLYCYTPCYVMFNYLL